MDIDKAFKEFMEFPKGSNEKTVTTVSCKLFAKWYSEQLQKRIKELESENKRLRSAALEVVSWDWRELQKNPDHIDWTAAPRSIDELEKALEGE